MVSLFLTNKKEHDMLSTIVSIKSLTVAAIFSTMGVHTSISQSEVDCLTQAIIFESTTESKAGKQGVANVIINRTKSGDYPTTVCKVVSQKSQFSYYPKRKNSVIAISKEEWQNYYESALIAVMALNGKLKDNTNGALFYVNVNETKNCPWIPKMKKTIKIDHHTFFKYV